jgi:hypothetical protein
MGIDDPVIVGHSISSGIASIYASIYAASYPVRGLVNVDGTVEIRQRRARSAARAGLDITGIPVGEGKRGRPTERSDLVSLSDRGLADEIDVQPPCQLKFAASSERRGSFQPGRTKWQV